MQDQIQRYVLLIQLRLSPLSDALAYRWTPAVSLNNSNIKSPYRKTYRKYEIYGNGEYWKMPGYR
jgi:hypothetical protein